MALQARGDIAELASTFKEMAHLPTGTVIYAWKADVNGDGKNEVFLIAGTDYDQQAKHDNPKDVPSWCVYLENADKSGYQLSRGTVEPELGSDVGPALPQIDPEKMYIGPISQLGKPGIVTIQTDYAKDLPAVSYICAYTIEGDHLKETLLAQYNPTEGRNPIYDHYLSNEHRTRVKLEKITVR